ncbi:MAG: hypothetical protein AVDCRST_MAG85-793, partial [uncultured Solirubrobacteraceae bacterium]
EQGPGLGGRVRGGRNEHRLHDCRHGGRSAAPAAGGDPGEDRALQAQAGGHEGESEVLLRPVRRPGGPRRQPRGHRPPGPRRLHRLRRAGDAPRAELDRARPPGGAHPPRALVRAGPRQQGGQLHEGQQRVDLRQRRRGDQGGLLRALRRRPEGPAVRAVHRRGRSAAHDLHAPQQDEPAAQRVDRPRRHLRPRHEGRAQQEGRPALPRHQRRAVRPHVRRPAPARRRRHVARGQGHEAGRVGLDRRGHDDRHRRPPAPGRDPRRHGEPRAQGAPLSQRRQRPAGRDDALPRRRALPPRREVLRGLPDGGHPSRVARADPQGRPDPHHRHLREQGPRLVHGDGPRGHLHRRAAATEGPLQAVPRRRPGGEAHRHQARQEAGEVVDLQARQARPQGAARAQEGPGRHRPGRGRPEPPVGQAPGPAVRHPGLAVLRPARGQASARPRDQHREHRELPLRARRHDAGRRGRCPAPDQGGAVAEVRQRGPERGDPPHGHHVPVAVQRTVRGELPARGRDLGLDDARLRRHRRWQPQPDRGDAEGAQGGQVRLLLPHPPVDAGRVRSREV